MTQTASVNTSTQTTGHQVVLHPSRLVRPVPSFVFAVPDGWVVDEAPGALCAIHADEAVDGFWNNALLTHDRVAKAVDLQAAASVSWGRMKAEAPTSEVKTERVARFGENVVYLRGIEVDAPQSGKRLAQLQAIFFAPSEDDAKTTDLFQLVCTSTPEQMNEAGKAFIEMIASFRFV